MKQTWRTVRELLGDRPQVYDIDADASVLAALKVMAEKNVGALMVSSGGRTAGIVSERDYARKIELLGKTAAGTKVREIMTADVIHVSPADDAYTCLLLMRKHRVRHLPVMDQGRLIGVLSTRNVVEDIIHEEELRIRDLELERLRMTTNTGSY